MQRKLLVILSLLVPWHPEDHGSSHCCRCLERGAQFVLLGSGHCDGEFRAMAEQQFKNHPDIRYGVK